MKNKKEAIKEWIELLGYSPFYKSNKKEMVLTPSLLIEKKINKEGFKNLCALHRKKDRIFDQMEKEDSKEKLMNYAKQITDLEFALQEAWGFSKDAKFHKFWEIPRCGCPAMDNFDAWPTGHYYINSNCPIHGKK